MSQVYFSWLYVPVMCIVPLLVLSVLNAFLIAAVRASQRQRKDMNVKQSRENNVTIMLVSVVIVFIICQVPALVYNIAFAINRQHVIHSYAYRILSDVRNFLVNLNSAVNFLLYCALGQKFRRTFLQKFCRRCVSDNYLAVSGIHGHAAIMNPLLNRRAGRTPNMSSTHSCSEHSPLHYTCKHRQSPYQEPANRRGNESCRLSIDKGCYKAARPMDRAVIVYTAAKDKRNQFH